MMSDEIERWMTWVGGSRDRDELVRVPHPDGEWVRYSDVEVLVERLERAEAAAHEHWQQGARDADAELGKLAIQLNKAEATIAELREGYRCLVKEVGGVKEGS